MVGIQTVDQITVTLAQCGGELSFTAADVGHKAALDFHGSKNVLCGGTILRFVRANERRVSYHA